MTTPRQINREAWAEANAGLALSDLEGLIAKARLEVAQYDAETGERAMVAETTADEILHSFRSDYSDDWSDIEHCLGAEFPTPDQLAERLVA
jgi:hypothetical protein